MVAVYNKDLLSWYLITLKLRETVEANVPRTSTSSQPNDLPGQTQPEVQKQQQEPSQPQHVVVKIDEVNQEQGSSSQDSEWVISIQEKLDQAHEDDAASLWTKICIYKVPHCLREGDIKAFVPQIVSLGPYYHGKRCLRKMDRHKWRCLQRMLKRNNQD